MGAPKTDIESVALTFIQSYASAMALAHSSPPTPLPVVASKLGSHYLPGFTSFTLGQITPMPDTAFSTSSIQGHLERLEKLGVGCDVREKKSRVDVVSSGSAMCWITWEILPSKGWEGAAGGLGKDGWEWENCYFYRRKMDGSEGFEGVIADGEIEGLVKHVPGIFG